MAQLVKNPPVMQETLVDFLVGKIPWRREQLPISVFCPGEFHGLYSPWGCKESDTTEPLSLSRSSGSQRDSESVGGESLLSLFLKPLVSGWQKIMLNDMYVHQWPFQAYDVCYASAAGNSSLEVSCETNHLPDCLRTSEVSRFFHSLLSNFLSLVGKSTVV